MSDAPLLHPDLLSRQLDQVLAELQEGHGDVREAACLAGLLGRVRPEDAALAEARRWLARPPAEVLLAGPFDAEAVAADVLGAEDPEAAEDALLALDEVCAGATFLGLTADVFAMLQRVVAAIEATPPAWGPHAGLARRVLAECPPAADDPAHELWTALAACPDEPAAWVPRRRRRPATTPAAASPEPPLDEAPSRPIQPVEPPTEAHHHGGLAVRRARRD